jgi:uncharacterized repeat protein (TIGR02543 family)
MAFYYLEAETLTLPEGLLEIGAQAFQEDSKLTSLTLPSTLKTIGGSAFNAAQLTELVIPEGVESIGPGAFNGSTFTSVSIPSSVKSIDYYAFANSTLGNITMGAATVRDIAFGKTGCTADTIVFLKNGDAALDIGRRGGTSATLNAIAKKADGTSPDILIEDGVTVESLGAYAEDSGTEFAGQYLIFEERNDDAQTVMIKSMGSGIDADKYAVGMSVDIGGETYTITDAQPVYHTVTFVDADGSAFADIPEQSVEENTTAVRPDDPVSGGRTFAGWYNGSELYDFDAPVTGDLTLTAKWNTKAGAVTISSLTYKNGAVTIDWDAVEGADGYRLYKKVPGGKWTKIKNTAVVTKYTDTNVEEGQTYYYVVRSHIDGVFNEDWAATAKSITPAVTPKPVTIADLSYTSGAVTVTWDEVPGADGYRVYKKTDDGSWARINNSTTSTTLTDKKVEPDTTYYYVVRSQVGGVYNTSWTETVQSITVPDGPRKVTITELTYEDGAVTISREAVPGVDGYRVYKKTAGGHWARINRNTTGTTRIDKNVEPGTKYYYTVRSQIGGVYSYGWGETVRSITIE